MVDGTGMRGLEFDNNAAVVNLVLGVDPKKSLTITIADMTDSE